MGQPVEMAMAAKDLGIVRDTGVEVALVVNQTNILHEQKDEENKHHLL